MTGCMAKCVIDVEAAPRAARAAWAARRVRPFTVALVLVCVSAATMQVAHGADPARDDGVRYLPDIHGRLAGARGDMPTNVCLRRTGSEITQCAYTDSAGRFRLPSFGEIHPARPGEHDWHGAEYPEYWLELGTRTKDPRRLWTVDLVDRRHVGIALDCDPSRRTQGDAAPVLCENRKAP